MFDIMSIFLFFFSRWSAKFPQDESKILNFFILNPLSRSSRESRIGNVTLKEAVTQNRKERNTTFELGRHIFKKARKK